MLAAHHLGLAEAGILAQRRESVGLDEAQADGQRVEAGIVLAHCKTGFGEVHIHPMARTGLGSGNADAAGVGEHVEQGLALGFGHDAPARGAQVEEQPGVLPRMAGLEAITHTQFAEFGGLGGEGLLLGRQGVGNARIPGAAVVPHQHQAGQSAGIESLQFGQLLFAQRAVEGLCEQHRAVAVDREPGGAFGRAVEHTVGIGLFSVQGGDQACAGRQGGRQQVGEGGRHDGSDAGRVSMP